jgi:hypothetical protein
MVAVMGAHRMEDRESKHMRKDCLAFTSQRVRAYPYMYMNRHVP